MGALELGLIYGLVALGVFISFKILNFPDLTVDGSFATGGAVAAIYIAKGGDPFTATLLGFLISGLTGVLTGVLNVKFHIMNLLAGILVMTGLYSVNLRIMGSSNVPLLNSDTVFSLLQPEYFEEYDYIWRPLLLLLVVLLVKLLLDWYFSTRSGQAMRATGANIRMAKAQGIATGKMIIWGMGLSNALVGLGGALFVQSAGGSDISMGIGTIVIGLASVILGQNIITSRKMFYAILAVIVGSMIYRFFVALAMNTDWIGLQAQDLNLLTAVLVAIALVFPKLKSYFKKAR